MQRSSVWIGAIVIMAAVGCSSSATGPASARSGNTSAHQHHHEQPAAANHDHDHGHEEHDPHDTLAGAVAELEKTVANVKAQLAAKNLDEADGHVHMVGHLVDDMHRLVAASGHAEEAKAVAKKALDSIFECFDALDTVLHSSDEEVRKKIDFLEHEPKVAAAIEELKKLAASAEEAVAGAKTQE